MIPVAYQGRMPVKSRSATRSLFRFGVFSVRMITLVIVALLGLLYIAQSSQGASKRLKVQELNGIVEDYSDAERQLQLDAQRAQTMDTFSNQAAALGLEPVDSVEYLK